MVRRDRCGSRARASNNRKEGTIGALSEYAGLAGRQHQVFKPPTELGGVAKLLVYGVVVYLALRLVVTLFRGPSRH